MSGEKHIHFLFLWSFLVWYVMCAVALVWVMVEHVVKEADSFKRQSRERTGQDSEKEVSEV